MTSYYVAAFLGAVLTAVAQLLLKTGARVGVAKGSFKKLFTNPYTFIGYVIFVSVTLLNLYALKEIRLIEMVFFVPLSYLLVILSSRWILKEKLSRNQWIGVVFLLTGLIIFNL